MSPTTFRRDYQWHLLALLWLVLVALGTIGFGLYAIEHNQPTTFLDDLYLALQLISMNSGGVPPPVPWELEVARFFIPLLAAATAVKAVYQIFQQQVRLMRVRRLHRHVIVCGLSAKGMLLVDAFRRQGDEVVVIEQDEDNRAIVTCRELGAVVLVGNAAGSAMLRRAGIKRAGCLFAVCDDDGVNAEIAMQSQSLSQDRPKDDPLTCLVHVADSQLCALLREDEDALEEAPFRLELFNVFDHGARLLLLENPAWDEARAASGPAPHLLVVGLGHMGENLVIHAARDWWNAQGKKKVKLKVTALDRQADWKAGSLLVRVPLLAKACDLSPLQMEVRSPDFERADFLFDAQGKRSVDAIYICLDDDSLGLKAGLALLRRLAGQETQVVVRMVGNGGLSKLVEKRAEKRSAYANLYAFALLERVCTPSLLLSTPREALARAAHEDYVRARLSEGRPPDEPALQSWDNLNETYRVNNYAFVTRLRAVLKETGHDIAPLTDWDAPGMIFDPAEVERMARLEHTLWCEYSFSLGWRYAPGNRDEKKHTHPALVTWDALSSQDQEKNRQVVRGIPAFLARAGYQVISLPS